MDLAGVQTVDVLPAAVSRLHSLTDNSTPNHAAIIFRLDDWSVSDRRRIQRISAGILTQTVLAPALTTTPEWVEARVHRDRAGVCCVRAWRCS